MRNVLIAFLRCHVAGEILLYEGIFEVDRRDCVAFTLDLLACLDFYGRRSIVSDSIAIHTCVLSQLHTVVFRAEESLFFVDFRTFHCNGALDSLILGGWNS